jgi:hypothetical protein
MPHTDSRKVRLIARGAAVCMASVALITAVITPDPAVVAPCRASSPVAGRNHNLTRCLTHRALAHVSSAAASPARPAMSSLR